MSRATEALPSLDIPPPFANALRERKGGSEWGRPPPLRVPRAARNLLRWLRRLPPVRDLPHKGVIFGA